MVNELIAAAMAAAAVATSNAPPRVLPDADPAIWVVNDSDTVIFLFGTFHALDGKSDWFNDEVRTAFSSADELVLETIIPDAASPPRADLAVEPAPRGLRSLSIAPSASFLASTRLALSAGRANGMKVVFGADSVLRRAAEFAGKDVEGLESFDAQLGMFSRMPGGQMPAGADRPNPRVAAQLATVMTQMQAAWNRGDQRIFTSMLDEMHASSPESYKIMFTERNSVWAGWIAARLRKPGTVFVAVGAGHLAGNDSVQAKLAQRGVRSSRIN